MPRTTPPGEDGAPSRKAGPGLVANPPGEDGASSPFKMSPSDVGEIENFAESMATDGAEIEDDDDEGDFVNKPTDREFLELAAEGERQSSFYTNQINRNSWVRTYRAFHQQHFDQSKYHSQEYKNRSRLFIPKTRAAVRKDMAAVAASLFGSIDAISCMAGNEGDDNQRASAAVVQELVNYRTDRNGKTSIPWFHVAMGARQTSLLTGFCFSKQSWKLELRRTGSEEYTDEDGSQGVRDVWEPHIDRPDIQLIPPENLVIDPAADWTNPAQDAAYIIIKWPMRIDEIRRRQRDPRQPWKELTEDQLRSGSDGTLMEAAAIRRAREQGIDRLDESQNTRNFDIIWVWETYIRTAGEDWTFLSIADKHMLTDPKPVREVYPEQFGERPLAYGYGSFEAFSIFPMSSAESWQMLQQEANDLRNLTLDAIKQNVMPVTKVRRGRQVDLEQLRRRGQGTAIMVQDKDDVTWEKAPDISSGVQMLKQQLDIEFDDLAGQQNYGTVQDNNALGRTLGGLKLAAGAANAVQEFDIRIWIETWVEVVLTQVVRLEQYYESDPIILGLCGDRAKLFEKYGINQISDELLENNVTVRVNIGLGAGDPQQRLAKFQSATAIAVPLLQMSPSFARGEVELDYEAVMNEVFGAAGYRDGGRRFIKEGQPQQPDPMAFVEAEKTKSETEKNKAMAKKAVIDALANAAKIGLGLRELNLAEESASFDRLGRAVDLGHRHGADLANLKNAVAAAATPAADGTVPADHEPIVQSADAPPAEDAAFAEAAPPEESAEPQKPRVRKVTITKRGPDGRATEFQVED